MGLTRALRLQNPLLAICTRSIPIISLPSRHLPQRRWVGTKYMAKVAKTNEEWAVQAKKIERGEGQYFWDFLEERGYVKDITGTRDQLRTLFNIKRVGGYVGVDPTADSLHIGHLVAFMPIFQMYLHGYPAFTLLGGATAKIGDPSGRLTTREQESSDTYRNNLFKIHYQLKQLWMNVESLARKYNWHKEWHHRRGIENNGVWWNKLPMLDILRYLGTDLRMGPLLGREPFKRKMTEGDGLSVTEFIYPLMQAWDWWTLWSRLGIQIQVGGSDQYGNIITGIEAFKVIRNNEPDPVERVAAGLLSDPVGFTVPLLTNSKGQKFGKSENNAIWIDAFKCPTHDLYGYFLRQSDERALSLLKLLTFIPTKDINELYEEHMKDPPKRLAHHRLAHEVSWLCHGKEAADVAERRHQSLHGGVVSADAAADDVVGGSEDSRVGCNEINKRPQMDMQLPISILEKSVGRVLVAAGLASSTTEGTKLANAQGAYVGGKPGQKPNESADMPSYQVHWTPVKNWFPEFTSNFLIDGKYLYLRKGKHHVRIIELVSDEDWATSGQKYAGEERTGEFRQIKEALQEANAQLKKVSGAVYKQGYKRVEEQRKIEDAFSNVGNSDAPYVSGSVESGGMAFPTPGSRTSRIDALYRKTTGRSAATNTIFPRQGAYKRPAPKSGQTPWMQRGSSRGWK